jgi:hypothetical protein
MENVTIAISLQKEKHMNVISTKNFRRMIFTLVIVIISLCVAVISHFLIKGSPLSKKDGFITHYNSLFHAFEKKEQLFNSGAIDEVTASFGLSKGEFSKKNEHGEGWSFIKNGTPIMWDGTKDGTVDIYVYWDIVENDNASKEMWSEGSLLYMGDRASLLSCYLGLPVTLALKSFKDVGNSHLMGTYENMNGVWFVVTLPNEVLEKSDIDDVTKVFSFAHNGILLLRRPYFDNEEGVLVLFSFQMKREEDATYAHSLYQPKMKDSATLEKQYVVFKNYQANSKLLEQCHSEKMKEFEKPHEK